MTIQLSNVMLWPWLYKNMPPIFWAMQFLWYFMCTTFRGNVNFSWQPFAMAKFRTTLQIPEDVHLVKCTICRFYAFIYFLMAEILYLGYIRQPKWSHLRDLHKAIKLCEEHLISSDPIQVQLGTNLELCNMY